MLISTGNEDFEALIIQVQIGSKTLRIFNCYGPQEASQAQRPVNEQTTAISIFWQELEKEIINAYEDGCMILIEMDANAKIGWNYIKNDPHNTSENGQILLELIDRQCLKILNCSPKCEGVISRQRITIDRIEQSVIDYVITCDEMSSFLSKMTIDDDRKFVLSKFFKGKTIESDHNIISAKFNLNYDVKKPEIRQEIFDFKSQEGQMKFYRATSYSNKFGSCFNPNFSPEQNMNKYFKTLNDVLHQCFDKIRIRSKGPNKLSKMSEIQMKIEATILRKKIQDIGDQLSDEIVEKNV